MQAAGTFEVALQPLPATTTGSDGVDLGRMSIDKHFAVDLEAASRGEMLSVRTPVEGHAGYVAIEQVTGSLLGKQGSFVLQHYGVMAGGDNRLTLEIVPGSATGELQGLTGQMTIAIDGGAHSYRLDYAFG